MILIIAGSGPTDRDGNSAAGLRTDSYKMLAEGLAAKGVTSLRVDKRGIAESSTAGPAEIDLRYLSSKRTLVLVDGLRWVNGTSASGIPANVDLNTIPSNMIERIEVLQAGASPLYGSDAIADDRRLCGRRERIADH